MPSGSDDSDDEAQGPHHNESKQPPKKHGKHHHADQAGHPDQHHHHEKLKTLDGRSFEINVVHYFKNDRRSHFHLENYKKNGVAKPYYVPCPGTQCTCSNKGKPISYDELPPKLKDPRENLGSAIAVMEDESTDTASIHPLTDTAPSAPPAENPDYLQPQTFHPVLHRPILRTPSTSIWGFFGFCCGNDDAVPDQINHFRPS